MARQQAELPRAADSATGPRSATGASSTACGSSMAAARRSSVARVGEADGDELSCGGGPRPAIRRSRPGGLVPGSRPCRGRRRDRPPRRAARRPASRGHGPRPAQPLGERSRQRRLSFSWRLVLAPPEALETVVVHELAHLRSSGTGRHSGRSSPAADRTTSSGGAGCGRTRTSCTPRSTRAPERRPSRVRLTAAGFGLALGQRPQDQLGNLRPARRRRRR